MGKRPGKTNGWCYRSGCSNPQSSETLDQPGEHRLFAAEQMVDAGDIEDEIAPSSLIGEDSDKRAGIGVPIGKISESLFDIEAIDLAQF